MEQMTIFDYIPAMRPLSRAEAKALVDGIDRNMRFSSDIMHQIQTLLKDDIKYLYNMGCIIFGIECNKCCDVYPAFHIEERDFQQYYYYQCPVCGKRTVKEDFNPIELENAWNNNNTYIHNNPAREVYCCGKTKKVRPMKITTIDHNIFATGEMVFGKYDILIKPKENVS